MKIVYASEQRVIAWQGDRIALHPGDPWDGDDPLVQANSGSFVAGPRQVRSTQDPSGFREVPAEQTTAPKRGPGRPPKAAK